MADRYRLDRELGAGGMATVYLAHDLKHDRDVAIKVLHPDLGAALGGERFLSEIRTTARLQHPHILPLLDSGDTGAAAHGSAGETGEANGLLYYVMPLVTGETLRARLDRETQLPIAEAVRIAREVASALDYAHRQGVIHRDIKPENILLHDGQAIVADFGIALAVQSAGGARMTQTGLSLGTPQYMSPEQAMGERTIDARSDIYALGAVLYEMLVGEPPFSGATVQVIVAKVLTERPTHPTALRDTVPQHVEEAVLTALAKLPADRFATPAQFAEALGNPAYVSPLAGVAPATVNPAGAGSRRFSMPFITVTAVAVAATITAAWLGATRKVAQPQPVFRTMLVLPDSVPLATVSGSAFSISRDGSVIAVILSERKTRRIWYRPSDQVELRPVAGTEFAQSVSVSPDGKRVVFVRAREVFVVGLDGSSPISLMAASSTNFQTSEPAWAPDGTVIASIQHQGLARFPASGGPGIPLSSLDSTNEAGHFSADVLPNGKGLVFTVSAHPSTNLALFNIAVLDVRTGKHRSVAHGVFARYVDTGHLLYVTADGALMAVPFDAEKLDTTGPAINMGTGIAPGTRFSLSSTGTLLYATGTRSDRLKELVWVSRDGAIAPVDTTWRATFSAAALSPDGRRVAVSIQERDKEDVWIRQLDAGTASRITSDGALNMRPSWLPDGSKVAFLTTAGGALRLVAKRTDGLGAAELVARERRALSQGFVSRDGKWVVYRSNAEDAGNGDILAQHLGDTTAIPLVATPAQERFPALSPDGKWLAYRSDETEREEVYVQPFPNVNDGKWTVSAAGGSEPVWSHSGKELFFINAESEMIAATISVQPTFSVASRQTLFKLPPGVYRTISHQAYDVAPDDRRFLMIRAAGASAKDADTRTSTANIVVVMNWLEELKAKVSGKR